jgi:hypothetical protein
MKTLITIFLAFAVIGSYAQNRLNSLSVNPIQLFGYNRLNIEYSRGFNQGKYALGIYFGKTGNSARKIHDQYGYYSEQSISVNFFNKKMDQSSFWYGGTVTVASGDLYDDNGIDQATGIGSLGVLAGIGYQYVIRSFCISPYINAGYALTNDLFGSAEYTEDMGKPTKGLLTYGFKAGFCF